MKAITRGSASEVRSRAHPGLLGRPHAETLSCQALREVENELSHPLFHGVPLGPTLNDHLIRDLFNGNGDWRWRTRWLNRARMARQWLRPQRSSHTDLPPHGRIWITWLHSAARLTEMWLPVLDALEGHRCAVLCGAPGVSARVPVGVSRIEWDQVLSYEATGWRTEYRRCRPQWAARLKSLCRRYNLPAGAFELFALTLMIASRNVTNCIAFLEAARPAAIVTDYDRNQQWSCIVLAARLLQIPTVTLVHGVMQRDAIGYAPVLADRVVCWGELGRHKLLAAGEAPEKILIGGCPRLVRDISASAVDERAKLGLDPARSVVMFATSPEWQRLELAELFCASIEILGFVSGVVRLHPSEKLATYSDVVRRHSRVRFVEGQGTSLDESLVSADVVVVHGSGVGSDALVKRRPVVVLDVDAALSGHNEDLVERAGCPHARTADDLAAILRRILLDEQYRLQLGSTAEEYVKEFCCAFGMESARRIAGIVSRLHASGGAAGEGDAVPVASVR